MRTRGFMDLKAVMDGSDGCWSEKRHSLFLNWIEASFIRRMFAGGGGRCPSMRCCLRLDRDVPDSATESTEDSSRRSPPAATGAAAIDPDSRSITNTARENIIYTRKRSLRQYEASHDQVVPEYQSSEDGDGASVKRKKGSDACI